MSERSTLEIACITDSRFARHTAAMLHSALTLTPRAKFRVHVLHEPGLVASEAQALCEVVERQGAELNLVSVGPERTAPFPSGYFPRAVYLRVLLPELLPRTEKVLYLDSDLIVTDSLQPLWDTDLGDALLGAVVNPFYPFMPDHPGRLGVSRADYLNSGVLLMDLESMRAERCVEACVAFARAHPHTDYPDQDCLNDVCRGRWQHLHPRWNVQSPLFELPAAKLPWPPAQVEEALTRPAAIHFIGPFKPWQYVCRHPRQALYFEHARATPWGAPELEGRTLANAVRRRLPLAWIARIDQIQRRLAARVEGHSGASGNPA